MYQKGSSLATAGIVLGWIGIAILVLGVLGGALTLVNAVGGGAPVPVSR